MKVIKRNKTVIKQQKLFAYGKRSFTAKTNILLRLARNVMPNVSIHPFLSWTLAQRMGTQ